eukprot:TRINITY_DN3871_c0_g1_i1.p1 TRINITY_DN3871_c0_g1~~TRINITY_DN3871_c0_g1_i1.p1  ORF type:complete len:593 (+),score=133.48 TRINITY_DN3871_c0_g1_i1:246-1781(+)
MPATVAELASMEETLQHLRVSWKPRLSRFRSYELPRLSAFKNAVASSKLAAGAAKAALERDCSERRAKCGSGARHRAQATVLASWDLLTHILSYRDTDDWYFTAPVSRLVRAAYTTAVIRETAFTGSRGPHQSAVAWVCRTRFAQAAHSHARLDAALLSKAFARAVRRGHCEPEALSHPAAAAGAAGLVQRFAALGVRIDSSSALCGAARLCDAAALDALCRQVLTPGDVRTHLHLVGQTLAERGDGGGALMWLSQQLQPPSRDWPPWYLLSLCQRAAAYGRLHTLQFLLGPGLVLFGPLDEVWLERGPHEDFFSWAGQRMRLPEAAAWGGDLSTVQWLVEYSAYKISVRMMEIAAHQGHLPVLRWLRGEQLAYACNEDNVCSKIAGIPGSRCTGHVLQYLRGCRGGGWSVTHLTGMLRSALMLNSRFEAPPNYSIAEFVLREGAQWPVNLCELVHTPGVYSLAELVLWALRQGCPWGKWGSDECDMLELVNAPAKWILHSYRCPCQCPRD